jgi:hypothetical protein
MDPTAALKAIRQLVREIQAPADTSDTEALAGELAELVDGLDGWLSAGGFLPHQWRGAKAPEPTEREQLAEFVEALVREGK